MFKGEQDCPNGSLRPLSERLVTNRAFTEALRKGRGPLTRVQRIGFFLFGPICVACGTLLLRAALFMPASMRQFAGASEIFYYAATTIMIAIATVLGCGCLALGFRTLRHVIWRAERMER